MESTALLGGLGLGGLGLGELGLGELGFGRLPFETVDWVAALGRLHPLLLHLPIGVLAALVCVELWRLVRRRREPEAARSVLVFLLAVTASAAATTGWLLHESEDYGDPVEWHEYLGIAVMFASLLAALAYWRRWRAYGWWLALAALLIVPTGHLGGTLTHGEDFLLEPWAQARRAAAGEEPAAVDAADPDAAGPDAAATAAPTGPFAFERAEPFFDRYCTRCHGAAKRKGGLALHDLASLLAGGESGPAVVAGDAARSRLVTYLRLPLDDGDHMPPPEKAQPTAAEIEALAAWIDGLDRDAQPAAPDLAARADALHRLRERLVHVERLARDSERLQLDFGAASLAPGDLAVLLGPIAEFAVEVDASGAPLSPGDLALLGRLPQLEVLALRRLAGAPIDLAPLGAAPRLRVINLAGTALAPGAAEVLASIAPLERAFLWGAGLADADLQALADARPDLDVETDGGPPSAPVESEPDVAFTRYAPPAEPDGAAAPTAPAALAPANSTCPVSGSPVDPRFAVVFEGRVVGFCCPDCPRAFWDDPEPYRAALADG